MPADVKLDSGSSSIFYGVYTLARASCISPLAGLKNCSHRFCCCCCCGSSNLPSGGIFAPLPTHCSADEPLCCCARDSRKTRLLEFLRGSTEEVRRGWGRSPIIAATCYPLYDGSYSGAFLLRGPRLNRRRSRSARDPTIREASLSLSYSSSFLLFPAIRCIVIDWPPPVCVCVTL